MRWLIFEGEDQYHRARPGGGSGNYTTFCGVVVGDGRTLVNQQVGVEDCEPYPMDYCPACDRAVKEAA